MIYDDPGNLTTDSYGQATYGGSGARVYDAENRMTSAQDGYGVWSYYTYNADGQRVRRKVNGVETWQVYGFAGELLAEYAASAAPASPQKEYGYRNGQLLVTAESPASTNVALAANGGVASASTSLSGFPASGTNNGDRKGVNWGSGGGWADSSSGTFPDWLQIDFNGSKSINEVDVFTLQDNYSSPSEPTETMTFGSYGLTAYDVQYWNGSAWVTVSGGSITGNNKVWRKITFAPLTTSKIRVLTNAAIDNGYSRITEVEAWTENSGSSSANINWLVTDQLGTPRMVFDKTGALANVKRHDYLPFGEELSAGQGLRSTTLGYGALDGVRQKFTSKERDIETGLDYFGARYYGSTQGRFTAADPLLGSGKAVDPQSWNRYAYVGNNPLAYVDPDGMLAVPLSDELQRQQQKQQQNTNPYTKTAGNPGDQAVDAELKKLFTDGKNGMVVGADAYRNQLNKSGEDSHYQLADGQTLHTIHVVGDEGGNRIVGVYAPEAFSRIEYEGGKDGIVSATNPNTGEVLGFAHVDVSSPAALQKNTQTTNEAGSRLLGNIGGPGADGQASAGNRHAHVTYYASAADRATARANKPATRTQMGDFGTKDAQHLRNFRTLVPKR